MIDKIVPSDLQNFPIAKLNLIRRLSPKFWGKNESKLHYKLKQRIKQAIKNRYNLVDLDSFTLQEVPYQDHGKRVFIPDLLVLYGKKYSRYFKVKFGFWVEVETLLHKWPFTFGKIRRKLRGLSLPENFEFLLVLSGRYGQYNPGFLKWLSSRVSEWENIVIVYKYKRRWRWLDAKSYETE